MKIVRSLRILWCRFQTWRLNHWADDLLREAEYHKRSAKHHSYASAVFWSKAHQIRARAVRMEAETP